MPRPDNAAAIAQSGSATLRRLIDYRRPYDAKRSMLYRQYLGHRDAITFPDGVTQRANTFAQYPQSNVETIASRVHDAFFAYEDWFEVRGYGSQDYLAAEKQHMILKKQLKAANLISAFEDIVRNAAIYGHCGLKVDWDWGYDIVNYMEPIPAINPETGQPIVDPMSGQPVIIGTQPSTKPVPRNRPRFTALDIYDLYIDPNGLTAAMVVDRTLGQMKQEAEGFRLAHEGSAEELYYTEGLAELEERITRSVKGTNADDVMIRVAEIWDAPTNTVTIMTSTDTESVAWKERRASYRYATLRSYQRPVYGGPSILLWNGYNPFAHKQLPILHTSYVRLPNEAYGIGAIEPIAEMVEAMSQFINMIRDNWNLGINKRYAFDINANIDHDALNRFNVPGGKIPVDGNPSNVLMPLPIHTPERGDYSIIELYRNLIEMTSGISDFYAKGAGGSGGNDTATGISAIIGESNFKFRMFIRNLELYIMQPLLNMCASMNQQYLTDEVEVQITDEAAAIPKFAQLTAEELVGNFSFDLVAANYVTNEVVKQRNMLAFANIAGQSSYLNEYEGLRELAKMFKIPNRDRILKTPEQVAQEQQQAQMEQFQMQEMLDAREHKQRLQEILLTGAVNAHKARTQAATKSATTSGSSGTRGRPRTKQAEGQIPGADIDSIVRELSSDGMGLRNLGTGKFGG